LLALRQRQRLRAGTVLIVDGKKRPCRVVNGRRRNSSQRRRLADGLALAAPL